jgi:hypothetical protein
MAPRVPTKRKIALERVPSPAQSTPEALQHDENVPVFDHTQRLGDWDTSDDEYHIIQKRRRLNDRRRRFVYKPDDPAVMMRGGLNSVNADDDLNDVPGIHIEDSRRAREERRAAKATWDAKDAARNKKRLSDVVKHAAEIAKSFGQKKVRTSLAQDEESSDQSKVSTDASRNTNSTVNTSRTSHEDASFPGDSLLDQTVSTASPESIRRPASALKSRINGTPATEASVLNLSMFKRRTRQPSMVRMVKERQSMLNSTNVGFDNDSLSDLNDSFEFNPDGESTPLHIRSNLDTHSRILTTEEVLVPSTIPPVTAISEAEGAREDSSQIDSENAIDQDEDETELPTATAEPQLHSTPPMGDADDPISVSSTMAEPLSSSPLKQIDTNNHRIPSSPPAHIKRKRNAAVYTENLKSMMPKRRQTVRPSDPEDEFAMAVDGDEDELSFVPYRARTGRSKTPGRTNAKNVSDKRNKTFHHKKVSSISGSQVSKTYGRKRVRQTTTPPTDASDVEDDDFADYASGTKATGKSTNKKEKTTSTQFSKSKQGKTLANKFANIDAFEMEFEEIAPPEKPDTGRSSSPQYR